MTSDDAQGAPSINDEARLVALRAAVDAGIASLDAGEGIEMRPEELRDYIRELGRRATERATGSPDAAPGETPRG